MQEQVLEIIKLLNAVKVPTYKVEKDLGFSNGLLKKGSLSNEKTSLLIAYFEKHAIGIPENSFTYKIYALVNPETDGVFYIGCTRQELHKRLIDHIGECGNISRLSVPSKKQAIIIALLKSGKRPTISLLEELKNISLIQLYKEASKKEAEWILKINPIGNDTRKLPKSPSNSQPAAKKKPTEKTSSKSADEKESKGEAENTSKETKSEQPKIIRPENKYLNERWKLKMGIK